MSLIVGVDPCAQHANAPDRLGGDADRPVDAVQHRRAIGGKERHRRSAPRPSARARAAWATTRLPRLHLVCTVRLPILPPMFNVTEAEAAAIRTAFEQGGEFSAAVELCRRFPGIFDNAEARECARAIAAWKPVPVTRLPLRR
jgi:hypothetical protein